MIVLTRVCGQRHPYPPLPPTTATHIHAYIHTYKHDNPPSLTPSIISPEVGQAHHLARDLPEQRQPLRGGAEGGHFLREVAGEARLHLVGDGVTCLGCWSGGCRRVVCVCAYTASIHPFPHKRPTHPPATKVMRPEAWTRMRPRYPDPALASGFARGGRRGGKGAFVVAAPAPVPVPPPLACCCCCCCCCGCGGSDDGSPPPPGAPPASVLMAVGGG